MTVVTDVVTEVVVDEVEFGDSKRQDEDRGGYTPPPTSGSPDDDTSLPFDL